MTLQHADLETLGTQDERPPETQDEDADDAVDDDGDEDDDVTDSDEESQADEDEDEDEDDESDPEAERIETIRQAAIEEGRRARDEEIAADARVAQRTEAQTKYKDLFPAAITTARAAAEGITFRDETGREVKLTSDQVNAILKPFEDFNNDGYNVHSSLVTQDLVDSFYKGLPEAVHADFTAAVDKKPMTEWLDLYTEHKALKTDAVKKLTLEDFEKLGPAQKAALAQRDLDMIKEGRKKGRGDKPGEPDSDGKGTTTKSFAQLRAAYGSGDATPAEEAEYLRQQAARASAG